MPAESAPAQRCPSGCSVASQGRPAWRLRSVTRPPSQILPTTKLAAWLVSPGT
ncbi:hypothetical protein BZL30_7883 [Mycobacterium kansasii]|uniref:Uncharacterized protein n=1 Tax=Mycobacterium kansasii TaxID=1768 RepID=A0A1V3WKX6_MYCKA|nr:hypothetical protein BZL30_7883 [Mycobacterium kansasii]